MLDWQTCKLFFVNSWLKLKLIVPIIKVWKKHLQPSLSMIVSITPEWLNAPETNCLIIWISGHVCTHCDPPSHLSTVHDGTGWSDSKDNEKISDDMATTVSWYKWADIISSQRFLISTPPEIARINDLICSVSDHAHVCNAECYVPNQRMQRAFKLARACGVPAVVVRA